ncbi:MAG: metallophosphoesterase family protein [Lachnospiraceae bacterium]|nr:metallophosphoesterase family protein [Lachnospiraceae bacterium]
MKIIHVADLHLDSKMTANLDNIKAKERRNELLITFNNMISYAVKNNIQAIIIAGDLFDTKNVSMAAKNVVRQAIENNSGIDFYYLKGNHDAESFLAQLDPIPDNLKLFSGDWTSYDLEEDIVLTGVELDKNNSNSIYNSLVLNMDKFNIVTLHGQESEHQKKDKAETINIGELRNKGIDYLALGHIHTYKKATLDARGIYCYPGCLEGRGFDECGEHGFVVIDIENKRCQTTFVPFACRNLYTVDVDVTGSMSTVDIAEKIRGLLDKKDYSPSGLLKLVLCGEIDVECEKDVDFLSKRFESGYYFLKIYDETKLKVDYNQFALDESLKGEFVRTVMSSADLTDEDKATIVRYGIQALAGEELN